MKNTQKGFIIPIAIAVIVLLIAGGTYLAVKRDEESIRKVEQSRTSDWKTYTNPGYGFSLQYPSDWIVETGDRIIARVHPSNQVIIPDTDVVIDQVYIIQEPKCTMMDWNVGFGDANYKKVCEADLNLSVGLVAKSKDTKLLEDKILSTFKFIINP